MVKDMPHSMYFEGVLQLRGTPKSVLTEIRNKNERDKKNTITRIKHFKFGTDVWFSDRKYLASIGKWLKLHHKGLLRSSAKLHKHKKGKPLYRLTVAFRYLPYKKGQGLTLGGVKYKVVRIDKEVTLQEAGGKKFRVKMEKLCA
ncbi:hypothetical protein CMO91_03855 [Candidatus Woesearchaeota archaeon]|nr:hypothetical protein [Candidatus Woesearchaeota archaeon]